MKSIAFLGRGGQGIVFAASVLAETLFRKGLYVAQLQSYGAEVRGGSVLAYVVYDEKHVDNPFIESFDTAVLLHEAAVTRWTFILRNSNIVIVNKDLVQTFYGKKVITVPLTRTLSEENLQGKENICSLGLIKGLGLVDYNDEDLIEILEKHTDWEQNVRAYNIGLKLGERIRRNIV